MPINELVQFAQSVGAPTVIAIFIVLRIERRLDLLADAILQLPSRLTARDCPLSEAECPLKSKCSPTASDTSPPQRKHGP